MPEEIIKPWHPPLYKRQFAVYNCYKRVLLVSGSRKSGKTISVVHRVIRHLWETDGARVGLFSTTIKTAKDGGVWQDIVDICLPMWLNSNMVGFTDQPIAYTTRNSMNQWGPKSDGQTRTLYFRIRNMWGGESELKLFSLDNENEIKQKLQSTRFSMLYFPELAHFKSRDVYRVGIQQLRMYHLRPDQHMWIADTNPGEEGQDSWIYKLFYEERVNPDHKYPAIRDQLELIEFFLEDNIGMTQLERDQLHSDYEDDEGEHARMVLGKWVKGHGKLGKAFADVFSEPIHVIPQNIEIAKETNVLHGGWDIGSGINHAFVMLEKRSYHGHVIWNIIDEVVSIGEKISTERFGEMCQDVIEGWESFYKRTWEWTHWADPTAVNTFRASADTYDYQEIKKGSKGKIDLENCGATKGEGSIATGLYILRRLLRERRLFVSGNCPHVIAMFNGLSRATDAKKVVTDNEFKHAFDALRYVIYMESLQDSASAVKPQSVDRKSVYCPLV